VAIFYASGVVFAVASGLLLLLNLWRLLSGQVPDGQLVRASGSEDVATLADMQLDGAAAPKPPTP
jgi:TRAP-type transport system small permease protein